MRAVWVDKCAREIVERNVVFGPNIWTAFEQTVGDRQRAVCAGGWKMPSMISNWRENDVVCGVHQCGTDFGCQEIVGGL